MSDFTCTCDTQANSKSFCFLFMFISEVGVVQKWTPFAQNVLVATLFKAPVVYGIVFWTIDILILFLQCLTVYRWPMSFFSNPWKISSPCVVTQDASNHPYYSIQWIFLTVKQSISLYKSISKMKYSSFNMFLFGTKNISGYI